MPQRLNEQMSPP